ncbi:single-stranded DNA-binding protein [uncultured Finegoldia sp.]|uniref:single-stranded DNA-binding protein n=1 Tax=uncultured Finegoldia sp. TaxID=328009 RepID=UPI0028057C1C|nr:single-stranded DNA-binding protein [uncultured Finegoldia sp.]MDU1409802.1 single-stranded DNA-binding protein [Veillonella sp.]
MNSVSLMGRLTRDPEVRYTANTQMANARFVVAVNRKLSKEKRQEAENNGYPTADFISCVAWGKTAENIDNYFKKGQRIAVSGHIQTGSYENQQGQRIYTTDVVVDSFDFVESNSSSTNTNQGYSNPADLGMSGQESFDSDLPF